jgi:Ala-tRNA(Pro) deacylase
MAISKKILNFLEKAKVRYEIIKHKTVFTAFDKSQTLKVPREIVGKTLILKVNNNLAFVLIPANKTLDLKKIRNKIRNKSERTKEKIELASERFIKNKIKGVKIGAIPPFGILWKCKTFIDNSINKEKEIILNSGDWNYSIKLFTKDLQKLIPDLIFGSFSKKK